MLKRIDFALIAAGLLLGVAHTSLTVHFYRSFSLDALWFAGTGLAFILAAVMNLVRRSSDSRLAAVTSFLANLVLTLYAILIVLKLPAPQAYAALVILGGLCLTSGLLMRASKPSAQSLEEVRSNIDALDRRIVSLMAERSHHVLDAARFKHSPEEVRDPQRMEQVITKVRTLALQAGTDPGLVERTYRAMIGAMIELEQAERDTISHRTNAPYPEERKG